MKEKLTQAGIQFSAPKERPKPSPSHPVKTPERKVPTPPRPTRKAPPPPVPRREDSPDPAPPPPVERP